MHTGTTATATDVSRLDVASAGLVSTPSPPDDGVDRVELHVVGMTFAGAICLTYLVVDPASQDFASGHFRAELAGRGVYLWNNLWFGGHPLPGYGLVSPVLGGLFGVVPVSVVSVLVATWCFALVIERWHSTTSGLPDPRVGVVLFAFGWCEPLGWTTDLPARRDVRRVGAAVPAAPTTVDVGGMRSSVRVAV